MSTDRIALVTGGAGGLGYSICTKLHEKGYRVVLTHSPNNTTIKETLADMKARGHDFHAYPVDVADYDSCQRCAESVTKDVGHIDILINNAGITRDMTFRKMGKADWDAVIRTNLDSMFNMTKQVIEGMLERGWGRVIIISSITGTMGGYGQCSYAATKAGLIGLTKTVAKELASRNIRVNAVAPGFIDTDMTAALPEAAKAKMAEAIPLARLGSAQDVADCVAWLASDKASYVTGEVVRVNGGMYM